MMGASPLHAAYGRVAGEQWLFPDCGRGSCSLASPQHRGHFFFAARALRRILSYPESLDWEIASRPTRRPPEPVVARRPGRRRNGNYLPGGIASARGIRTAGSGPTRVLLVRAGLVVSFALF